MSAHWHHRGKAHEIKRKNKSIKFIFESDNFHLLYVLIEGDIATATHFTKHLAHLPDFNMLSGSHCFLTIGIVSCKTIEETWPIMVCKTVIR